MPYERIAMISHRLHLSGGRIGGARSLIAETAMKRPRLRRERMTRRAAVPVLILAGFLAIPNACAQQSDWEWIAEPYIWAPSISTDIDVPPVGTDSRFADIIDKIDGAFAGPHRRPERALRACSPTSSTWAWPTARSFTRVQTSGDLDMSLVDVAGVWSPGSGRMQGAEVFAGLRYIDVDLDVRLVPVNPALSAIDAGLDNSSATCSSARATSGASTTAGACRCAETVPSATPTARGAPRRSAGTA